MKQVRKLGWACSSTHVIGKGFPDIAVGARGKNYFFEIKDPMQTKSGKKLTPDEIKWHAEWTGQVHIAETIDDIVKIIQDDRL